MCVCVCFFFWGGGVLKQIVGIASMGAHVVQDLKNQPAHGNTRLVLQSNEKPAGRVQYCGDMASTKDVLLWYHSFAALNVSFTLKR